MKKLLLLDLWCLPVWPPRVPRRSLPVRRHRSRQAASCKLSRCSAWTPMAMARSARTRRRSSRALPPVLIVIDTNKDGKLSQDELAAWRKSRAASGDRCIAATAILKICRPGVPHVSTKPTPITMAS